MSKRNILHHIRIHKPPPVELPEIPFFEREGPDLERQFRQAVESGGGKVSDITSATVEGIIQSRFPASSAICSSWTGYKGNVDLSLVHTPAELVNIDVALVPASFAVAENGAVWLTETDCVFRVLPFIAEHLIVILHKDHILPSMHEAYQRIKIDETGFGVFVAGPSKTADIEQSLVTGAQGARSLWVLLYG